MQFPSPSILLAVFTATAIGFAATRDSNDAIRAEVAAKSCKPSAPVKIALSNMSVANGIVRFDYSVTPTISGLSLASTLELPSGAKILEHSAIARQAVAANQTFTGHGTVRLGPGTRSATPRVSCAIEFMGSDQQGDLAPEVATSVTELLIGDAEITIRNIELPRATSGSEPSLEVPAVRSGGSSR